MDPVRLTKELVSFASPSHLSNSEISQFILQKLELLEFETETVQYVDDDGVPKVNVVGKKGFDNSEPGLAYFCHSDVVPAENWNGPGEAFSATEDGNRLYGRGSCDMKGSAACMLSAISRVAMQPLTAPLYFVCNADEELSYVGAKQLVAQSQIYREMVTRQTRALIGEPTELDVVYAHKGICKLVIVSQGEAAHSSTLEGLNANLAMIPFLQDLKQIHDETENDPRWQNTEFQPPTLSWNIGLNDHTKAINVKAARSVCTVFYRPLPRIDDRPLLERVASAAKNHGLQFEMASRCEAVYTEPSTAFVREALEIAGRQTARTVAYGTDAGELTELRQKIICGPGSIAQAHTSDEWIALDQLSKGTELYGKFLEKWCL